MENILQNEYVTSPLIGAAGAAVTMAGGSAASKLLDRIRQKDLEIAAKAKGPTNIYRSQKFIQDSAKTMHELGYWDAQPTAKQLASFSSEIKKAVDANPHYLSRGDLSIAMARSTQPEIVQKILGIKRGKVALLGGAAMGGFSAMNSSDPSGVMTPLAAAGVLGATALATGKFGAGSVAAAGGVDMRIRAADILNTHLKRQGRSLDVPRFLRGQSVPYASRLFVSPWITVGSALPIAALGRNLLNKYNSEREPITE